MFALGVRTLDTSSFKSQRDMWQIFFQLIRFVMHSQAAGQSFKLVCIIPNSSQTANYLSSLLQWRGRLQVIASKQHKSLRRFIKTNWQWFSLSYWMIASRRRLFAQKLRSTVLLSLAVTKMAPLDFGLSKAPRYVSYTVVEFLLPM